MKQDRRTFLKTIGLGFAGAGVLPLLPEYLLADNSKKYRNGVRFENGIRLFDRNMQKDIKALANLIIPSTENIDIKMILLNYFSRNIRYAKYMEKGFKELNSLSEREFKKPLYLIKSDKDKKNIVSLLEEKEPDFFANFRVLVIKLYYSHPYSWKKLAYEGPPQPIGFPDYHLPPKQVV